VYQSSCSILASLRLIVLKPEFGLYGFPGSCLDALLPTSIRFFCTLTNPFMTWPVIAAAPAAVVSCCCQVEPIALLANSPETGFVGVYMYCDDQASIKQLPANPRATAIAATAGMHIQVSLWHETLLIGSSNKAMSAKRTVLQTRWPLQ
jgi:hypothetical protein